MMSGYKTNDMRTQEATPKADLAAKLEPSRSHPWYIELYDYDDDHYNEKGEYQEIIIAQKRVYYNADGVEAMLDTYHHDGQNARARYIWERVEREGTRMRYVADAIKDMSYKILPCAIVMNEQSESILELKREKWLQVEHDLENLLNEMRLVSARIR